MQRSVLYTILFATAVCIVCAVVVSSSAVSLKERQLANAHLEKQRNVLMAAGLLEVGEKIGPEEVLQRFETIRTAVIELATGEEQTDIDPATFDPVRAAADPATSTAAPDNTAGVRRLPDHALVYQVLAPDGDLEKLIVPIEGYGLWSTLYGFIALDEDLDTVKGITFYQHGETPGLGGEVDNPKWKAKWEERKVFDEEGTPQITVIKGQAGLPADDPFRVDGLSGATITSRGVTNLVHFWLGDDGFGPYLEKLRQGRAT